MKLSRVLTACNDKYNRFIPVFIEYWLHFYPEARPVIIYIGKSGKENAKYKDYIVEYDAPSGLPTAYVAQTIRLLYAALLNDCGCGEEGGGGVLITDIDMLPGNSRYFTENIRDYPGDMFINYRQGDGITDQMIYMCYNIAPAHIWSEIFGIHQKKDIDVFLIENFNKGYDSKHGGNGWFTDQELFFKYFMIWKNTHSNYKFLKDSETQFIRCEPWYLDYNIDVIVNDIKSGFFADCHLYSAECRLNRNKLEKLIYFRDATPINTLQNHLQNIEKNDIIQTDCFWNYFKNNSCVHYIQTDVLFDTRNWRDNQHLKPEFNITKNVMITSHSDRGIDDVTYAKYSNKARVWFSNNIQTEKDNLFGLPIGITNSEPNSYLHSVYSNLDQIIDARKLSPQKKYLCYMNFNISTYSDRQEIWNKLFEKAWITKGAHCATVEGRWEFLKTVAQSKFCICPRGNGIDTHRLWESLYLGTIPVVINDIAHKDWKDLPILFIENWDEISEEYLNTKWVEMTQKTWNLDKLKVQWWIQKINREIMDREGYYIRIDFKRNVKELLAEVEQLMKKEEKPLYLVYEGELDRKYIAYFEEFYPCVMKLEDVDDGRAN